MASISSALFPALDLVSILANYDEASHLRVLESWLSLKLDYSEQYGLKRLRELISVILSEAKDPHAATKGSFALRTQDDVLITTGASEAIYLLFSVLANSDSCFIVQKPIYQSLYQVAADKGAQIIDWDYDAALTPDENINRLETIFTTCPKLTGLVLNNPNNPLGTVITDTAMQRIAGLLEPYQAHLIVDEVFRPSSLVPVSSAINYGAIVIGDISKSYSCPGLRLGWIASQNQKLLAECSALKNYLSLRSSTLSELIACSVLEHANYITERNRKIAKTNLVLLQESGLKIDAHPDYIGGPVLFPCLPAHINTELFIVKGDLFGADPGRFRLGFGSEPQEFKHLLPMIELSQCQAPNPV